jgi:peptidyl-prolyl cis-trans isomerase C
MCRRRAFYATIILILVLGYVVAIPCEAAGRYAAKVNGTGIKNATLDTAVNNFVENQKMLGIDIKEGDMDRLREDILEELISAELLYQESKKAGPGDLKEDVNKQFENIKNGFNSEEEFRKILKERGVTEKELRDDIEKGIYIKAFLDRDVYNDISITEAEKKEEYEKNKDRLDILEHIKASHILIRVEPGATDDDKKAAKKKIDDLRKRVLAGEDFAELARNNSEDASAANGGELGYFKRSDMVKPFEDMAFSLEKGETSKVVETQFGYHLIKLLDKRPAHTLTYNEVEKDIERFLLNQNRQKELAELINGLRENAKIKRY